MTIRLSPVEPDMDGFMRTLRRKGTPSRVHYFEHGIANEVQVEIAERHGLLAGLDRNSAHYRDDSAVALHRFLGHEFFRVFPPQARLSAPQADGRPANAASGVVSNWDDLDRLNWPDPCEADLSVLEYYESKLPENMRVFHVVSVWEVVRDTMGFETACLKFYDDPALVAELFGRVGGFVEKVVAACCDFRCYGGVYVADDLGYKTALMISPEAVRTFVMPWHQRIADLAHAKGKLLLLHSCGQMYALMDEYIDQVRIDAKHSFEDVVLPVTEAKRIYGQRLTLLGGMDVDLLARGSESDIRRKTREILDACFQGGGYFLGSGNWVTSYIPPENYLAMLDEARRYGG